MTRDLAAETQDSTNGVDPAPDIDATEPGDSRSRSKRGPRMIPFMLAALLLGVGGGIGGFFIADRYLGDSSDSSADSGPITTSSIKGNDSVSEPSSVSDGNLKTPAAIYERVAPAVVHINANVKVRTNSFFGPQEQEGEASGSGFVIDRSGHIVTNAHVVDGAESVEVSFEGKETFKADIVGVDASTDIAVLSVDARDSKLKKALSPVSFGASTAIRVGDPVVAIGNPFNLDRTLTTGVVSALQRELRAPNGFAIEDVIQTDAAVNPGNSGGPLLNMRGEVIGVNSQIQTGGGQGNDGIAFAVPSNTVKRIVTDLIDTGKVEHAWLGVSGTDIDASIAELFNLPADRGVLIGEVADGSPADSAGIEGGKRRVVIDGQDYVLGGDVVVEFDGEKVTTMRGLADAVASKRVGDSVKIVWYHNGKKQTDTVKLGTRPDDSGTQSDR